MSCLTKKAEEDAPKPGGAAGIRRIRRNVTWTGRSTSPRLERMGAETIGVERARRGAEEVIHEKVQESVVLQEVDSEEEILVRNHSLPRNYQ